MTIQKLMNKHKYITDINKFNEVINVTVILDIKYQYSNDLIDFQFKTLDECDNFLDDNYLKIKYEVMEEILKEQNEKIDNQRKQLHNLGKCYLKAKRGI